MHRLVILAGVLGVLAACQEYDIKGAEPEPELEPEIPEEPPPTPQPEQPPVPQVEPPDIEVQPLSLDFGFLPSQCLSGPEVVTVSNVGGSDLQINDIFFNDNVGAFAQTGAPAVLAPGESFTFDVEFFPPTEGDFLETIRIASNDPDESYVDVLADGRGQDSGLISEGFTQASASQVDVLFVLDNSGSMSDNLDALADEFPIFINQFIALGLDYQIGIVTTDMDDPTQSGRLQGPIISNASSDPVGAFVAQTATGATGSGDERGLDAAYQALDPSFGLINSDNAGFARPGATLSIIVVTDENDSSDVDPVPFTNWLNAYQGDPDLTSLSVVGGPKQGLFPCFALIGGISAAPVPRYWNVARPTGGIHANICNLSFDVIVQQLATVAAGLQHQYDLTGVPDDPASITVTVDGAVLPQNGNNGWTYDPTTNQVEFHGAGVPGEGSDVEITFEGETVCPN